MNHENPYVQVDIDMEVDPPVAEGLSEIDVPSSAYVSYVIDRPGAQYGEEGRYDGMEAAVVPATSLDIVRWQGAHRVFRSDVLEARVRLQAQEDAYLAARAKYVAEVMAAVSVYQPVQSEIEARKAMVEMADDLQYERDREDREKAEQAALDAEDAVMGERSWVLYRAFNGKKTLHVVQCSRYTLPDDRSRWAKPMRVADAREALSKPNVKACKRCHAEDHLRQAGYGHYTSGK